MNIFRRFSGYSVRVRRVVLTERISVAVISVFSSLIQSIIILYSAHIIGASEYRYYSASFVSASFINSIMSEWTRLSVGRFSGIAVASEKAMVMSSIIMVTEFSSVSFAVISIYLFLYLPGDSLLEKVLPSAILLASATALSDVVLAYIRFNLPHRVFNVATVFRVLLAGIPVLITAIFTRKGSSCVVAFSLGTMLFAALARCVLLRQLRQVDFGALVRVGRFGFPASISTLATNAAFSISRLGIINSLTPVQGGLVTLGLDLCTRGVVVFGQALNLIISREMYANFEFDDSRGAAMIRNAAKVFCGLWVVLAVPGAILSVFIPLVMSKIVDWSVLLVLFSNCFALALIGLKLYFADIVVIITRGIFGVFASGVAIAVVTACLCIASFRYGPVWALISLPISACVICPLYFYFFGSKYLLSSVWFNTCLTLLIGLPILVMSVVLLR